MPVVVTEENQQKVVLNQSRIDKAKDLLGAKTESETLELALEKVIEEFELKKENGEAEEDFDIDVHKLNRIPPKTGFKVKANFKIGGRRKPMKYDFGDFEEENNYDG